MATFDRYYMNSPFPSRTIIINFWFLSFCFFFWLTIFELHECAGGGGSGSVQSSKSLSSGTREMHPHDHHGQTTMEF